MEEILKNISPRIDKKMNDYLTKKFTSQEIEEAINQMAPSKAPGPNGFPALFYQRYWEIVGPNTVSNCLEILNDGADMKDWNNTNITLIPKVKNPPTVANFRPISLCNEKYKIVTKVLA